MSINLYGVGNAYMRAAYLSKVFLSVRAQGKR
jgi:hypothetical protein